MLGAPLWREVSLLEAEGRSASRLSPTKVILPSCGDKGQYLLEGWQVSHIRRCLAKVDPGLPQASG